MTDNGLKAKRQSRGAESASPSLLVLPATSALSIAQSRHSRLHEQKHNQLKQEAFQLAMRLTRSVKDEQANSKEARKRRVAEEVYC